MSGNFQEDSRSVWRKADGKAVNVIRGLLRNISRRHPQAHGSKSDQEYFQTSRMMLYSDHSVVGSGDEADVDLLNSRSYATLLRYAARSFSSLKREWQNPVSHKNYITSRRSLVAIEYGTMFKTKIEKLWESQRHR